MQRKSRAPSAWFCVDAATRPSMASEVRNRVTSGCAQLSGMTLAVEEDVAPDPRDVGRLRTSAVVAKPSGGPHAIEQALLGGLRWTFLMKRTRVAAPAGAEDRRVDRSASFRYFLRAAW
jgi:hypothetical protein